MGDGKIAAADTNEWLKKDGKWSKLDKPINFIKFAE
jgi:hypothetical protein